MSARVRVGDELNTRGGWRARIIWIRADGAGFYAVHKPETDDEMVPVFHLPDGHAAPIFVVFPVPCYDGSPADILL
jgi:hypothetical protein